MTKNTNCATHHFQNVVRVIWYFVYDQALQYLSVAEVSSLSWDILDLCYQKWRKIYAPLSPGSVVISRSSYVRPTEATYGLKDERSR